MLVDSPCKLVIQLPGEEGHDHREESNNAGHSNKVWLDFWPDWSDAWLDESSICQLPNGLMDLVVLDRSVDEHPSIVHAQPDDLNGILQS